MTQATILSRNCSEHGFETDEFYEGDFTRQSVAEAFIKVTNITGE